MRELPPADPFPVEALGNVLQPAARAINDIVQAPLSICGQSVLATATLAVQAHTNVQLPMHQAKPLSCYFITVVATGERKSAVEEALWPVRKRETTLRQAYFLRSLLRECEGRLGRCAQIGDQQRQGRPCRHQTRMGRLGPATASAA
jgi:hypothetical protein